MPYDAEGAAPAREPELGAGMQPCYTGCRKRNQPTFRFPLVGKVLIRWHRLAWGSSGWARHYATDTRSTSTAARLRFPSTAVLHPHHISERLQATFSAEANALSRLELRGLRNLDPKQQMQRCDVD